LLANIPKQLLSTNAGIDIPLYGAFLESDVETISSYYYFAASASLSYILITGGTQYSQIANATDEIRYSNGSDTVNLLNEVTFNGLQHMRCAIDIGIGWQFTFHGALFGAELCASLPLTTVLNDTGWKQYFIGIRTIL
jgi:hypothetical protein